MNQPSPLIIEIRAPFAGRTVAVSTDPDDCRVILQRLADRKRREARGLFDPATAAVILTEVDRYEKLIAVVSPRPPATRMGKSPADEGAR